MKTIAVTPDTLRAIADVEDNLNGERDSAPGII